MKILTTNRLAALTTLGVMTLGTVLSTLTPAQASSKNWKKAAIAGAAVTGYGLLKHNGKATTLGAIATGGSYLMYRKSKKKEARRNDWARRHHRRHRRHHRR